MFWWGGLEAGKVAWKMGRKGVRMVLQGSAEDKCNSPLPPLPWDSSPPGVPLAHWEPRDYRLSCVLHADTGAGLHSASWYALICSGSEQVSE